MRTQPNAVRGDARELHLQHAHRLVRAFGNAIGNAQQLLDGQRVARASWMKARDNPCARCTVCACDQKRFFGGLLDAGVQVADLGIGLDDGLAVDLEHDLQHAVRRRMLRTHREHHRVAVLADDLRHQRLRCGRASRSRARFTCSCNASSVRPDGRRAGDDVALVGEGRARRTFARRAAHRIILAQRVAFPVVRHLNAPQIGVPVEDDAEQIVDFALGPIRRLPEIHDAGEMRLAARRHRRARARAPAFRPRRRGRLRSSFKR